MSPLRHPRWRRARPWRREESGFTLLETVVAGVISLLLIGVVFLTTSATLASQESSLEEGFTTPPTALAANAVEQLLNNALVPNTTSTTSNCYDGVNGTPSLLTSQYGPFLGSSPSYLPSATQLYICSVRPGTTAAYTYQIWFTTCGGAPCLAIDRWSCSSTCTATRVDAFPGLSPGAAPFTYYYENGSTWSQLTTVTTSNVSEITAVVLDFSTPTAHPGRAQPAEVRRTVVLPSTLGGYA